MILGFSEKFKDGTPTNFVSKILKGEKKHTIRAGNRWRPGMMIQMATGVRTKMYNQFNKENYSLSTCKSVQKIQLDVFTEPDKIGFNCTCRIDGLEISYDELESISINDGFSNFYDFIDWFWDRCEGAETLTVFEGQIIHWTDLKY